MSILDTFLATAVGKRMDTDGHYGLQCVDVIDYMGEFIFGVPWQECVGGVRGAKDLLDVAPDKYWTRIDYYHGFIPEPADVLVYGGDIYNEWGHTAPTVSATPTYIDVVQQDGFATPSKFVDGAWYSDKPVHKARLNYSGFGYGKLMGVLRPKPEMLVSDIGYQGGTTNKPVPQEDTLSAAEVEQINKFTQALFNENTSTVVKEVRLGAAQVGDTVRKENYSNKVFSQAVMNENGDRVINDSRGQIAGLKEAIKQIASGGSVDLDAVFDAAYKGAGKAVEERPVAVSVNVEQPKLAEPVAE